MPNNDKEPPPEGPEVKRIVDQMREIVVGKSIHEFTFCSGRYLKKEPDGYQDFKKSLPIQILDVKCKGKFIYFELEGDRSIWNTLGLTGGWSKNIASAEDDQFVRAIVDFDDSAPIFFSDMRNFGTLKFVKSKQELTDKLDSLGPDILVEDLSDLIFRSKLKNRGTKTLPEILMDQSVISGIGNYIKAEALYLSKLSPHRLAGTLTDAEIVCLNRAIHSVIRESYKTGGSTFKTYADFNGDVGTFTDRFMVYGRKKDPQGNPVIREETKDKRTTHWVPKIQK